MRRSYIVAIILLFPTFSLFAQGWTPFVKNINGNPPIGAAFLNESYGFVSIPGVNYRTTDGGKTWARINIAGNISKSQFYFYTPGNIFFGGKWESIDSGMTWKLLPKPAASGNIYIKNNIFYDASGMVSYDHAKTWDTINKNFSNGETISGNLDNGIAMWGGSYGIGNNNENPTLYTTTAGKNWKIGDVGVESDFGYAIPFTPTYFRAGGDGNDAIQRSDDAGATWHNVFGPFDAEYLSDGFAGDGCMVFAQTMNTDSTGIGGVIRSTDQGASWQPMGGPIGRDDAPLCGVTSRGAVCYAMSYKYGEPLWKFKDPSLVHPILSDTKITRSFPDTIFMSECDSAKKINLQLSFSSCDFIRFQDMRIDSLPSTLYRTSYTSNSIVRTGFPASGSITFFPNAAGIYNVSVHIHLAASDWSGSDTTLPLVLVIKSNPATLTIDKTDTVRFQTKTLCFAGGIDTIHLSNLSCRGLKVKHIKFEADQMTSYDFGIVTSPPSTIERNNPTKKIIIHFHPQTPGIKNGNVIIETSIGSDTIPVYANVLPDPKILVIKADTFRSPVCDSAEGTITLHNLSCREITLDSLSFPYPYLLLPIRFPVILSPGDSALLHVRFTPSQRGSSQITAKAKLNFSLPYGDNPFDTTITLSGFATHGASAYGLSENTVTFDTMRMCDSARKHIVFYSTGCDSLPFRSISISGDPDFQMSNVRGQVSEIANGDSVVLDIALNPFSVGNKSAVITITLSDNSKITIPVTASIIRAVRTLSMNPTGVLDFGTHLTCENSDTLITLTNHCCDTVKIFDVKILGRGFAIPSGSFPIFIPPYQNRQINVQTILDTAGGITTNSATLDFISNADNAISPIALTKSYIYPHPVHLWLEADKKSETASGVVTLKVKGLASELIDVSTIDFTISYNSDLLGYFLPLGTITANDGACKSFTIYGSPAIVIDPDSSIGGMQFEVYLTKDTTTTFLITTLGLNNSDPKFMECVAYPLTSGVDFTYVNTCTDASIRRFMRSEPMQFSIRPNPVQDEIEIAVQSPVKQNAGIEIRNALGAQIFSGSKNLVFGSNSIHVDTKNLSEGMYFVRVTSASGAASQNFVRVK